MSVFSSTPRLTEATFSFSFENLIFLIFRNSFPGWALRRMQAILRKKAKIQEMPQARRQRTIENILICIAQASPTRLRTAKLTE